MVLEQIDPPQGRKGFGQLNTFGKFSISWILPPQGFDIEDDVFAEEMLFLDNDGMLFLDDDPMLFLDTEKQLADLRTHTPEDITTHDDIIITTHLG